MKVITLVGDKAEAAYEAVNLVETSLYSGDTVQGILDNLAGEKKRELVQGLCSILSIWSYHRFPEEEASIKALIDLIKESIEWEADKGRNGLHAKYQAFDILEASTGEDQEFYTRLTLISDEEDKGISLTGRSKNDDNIIIELMNWFRYYSWFGYGKTGPENCEYAIKTVNFEIWHLIDRGTLYGDS